MTNASDIITTYEGRDGYAMVDKDQLEWLTKEIERLKLENERLHKRICVDARISEQFVRDNDRLNKQVESLKHEVQRAVNHLLNSH